LYVDLWVEGQIVVEVKALYHLLTNDEVSQVINYLAATGAPVGLLINPSAGSGQPLGVSDWIIGASYRQRNWMSGRYTSEDSCGGQSNQRMRNE
jgi:hypothetical protein